MSENIAPNPHWLGNVLSAPYSDMMRQFFIRSADDIERQRLPLLNRQSWHLRREQVRHSLINALGGFPERTPLNAKITNIRQRQGYRIENIIFESRPKFYVTASVFVPDNLQRPAPAILCPHGHWQEGRYAEPVQQRCVGLARRGYIVLSLDAVGYNERLAEGHRRSWYLFSAGLTLQNIAIWDNIRAIDYLCSRSDVDSQRIGCTGTSGGGNQTMYVSALDERIKVSVPVCSVEMVRDYMEKGFCTCEAIPGILSIADLSEICGLIAPRALLVIHGMLDTGFPILSARQAASRIREIYSFYDSTRFAAFESFDGHGYNAEMRQAMYDWFDRWFMGRQGCGEEESPGKENLQVTDGSLPADSRTLASLFREHIENLPAYLAPVGQETWQIRRQHIQEGLAAVLGGWPERCPLDVRLVGEERKNGYRLQRFWFRSEPDIIIPACLLWPDGIEQCDVTIFALAEGKDSLAEADAQAQLAQGRAIMAFDFRGTGETPCRPDLAFLPAFALGRPLVGLYAWDILRCLDYLRQQPNVGQIHLAGGGSLTAAFAALIAAAVDKQIASLRLDELPATLRHPSEMMAMDAVYLPNVLAVADIPDLLASIAPRSLQITRIIGSEGKALGAPACQAAMNSTAAVYALYDAADALHI